MEVREIVETIVREPVLEVRFRLDSDSDDVIRISEFIISEIQDYGYNVLYEGRGSMGWFKCGSTEPNWRGYYVPVLASRLIILLTLATPPPQKCYYFVKPKKA